MIPCAAGPTGVRVGPACRHAARRPAGPACGRARMGGGGPIIGIMNPLLSRLKPYPFERLRQLVADITPNPAHRPISLGIGEPKHPTPQFIKQALAGALDGLASYPATAGDIQLREACAGWVQRRYGVTVDPATQVLPING